MPGAIGGTEELSSNETSLSGAHTSERNRPTNNVTSAEPVPGAHRTEQPPSEKRQKKLVPLHQSCTNISSQGMEDLPSNFNSANLKDNVCVHIVCLCA